MREERVNNLAVSDDIWWGVSLRCLAVLSTDDSIYVDLKLADQEDKSSEKIPGGTSFEESFTFLVYDLASEKVEHSLCTIWPVKR